MQLVKELLWRTLLQLDSYAVAWFQLGFGVVCSIGLLAGPVGARSFDMWGTACCDATSKFICCACMIDDIERNERELQAKLKRDWVQT